jgi:hypothetical protein
LPAVRSLPSVVDPASSLPRVLTGWNNLSGLRRFSIQLAILCAVAFSSTAVPASAAPDPKSLGQSTQAGKEITPCSCSAWQFGDLGTALGSYGIPYDGVIVKSAVRVGALTNSTDTFQPQTAHKTGSGAGTVASAGATHNLSGLGGTLARFYERFPAHAGDVLGARFFTTSFFIEYTNALFGSSNTADEIATKTPALSAGESFTGASTGTKERVNVEAWLEPDEDHDGYGDVSQDLCPGSSVGGSACSGSLFGSNFAGVLAGSGSAGSDSLYVQTALSGGSTALPARGVVVRWRVLSVPTAPSALSYQLRVLAPSGGGYTVTDSSVEETLAKNLSAEAGAIGRFATRLPVPAGGYVGIATGPLLAAPTLFSAPGNTMSKLADGADGTSYASLPATSTTSIVGYDADIEPDVDGDGYGDVSQDSCPSSASVHEGPCPPSPPAPIPAVRPQITGFKAVPKSFRVKPGGAIVSRGKGPQGTKLQLTLSTAATVAFAIESKLVCKPAKKTAHRCKPGFHKVHAFSRSLPRGASSLPYSGRYKRAGKVKNLKPGPYRVTAVPSNTAGTGTPARTTFTVLR